MTLKHSLLTLAAAFLLLSAAGCEDPSNVGIGLIDDQTVGPETAILQPSRFEPSPYDDVTGNNDRILAGQVQDPMLAAITAHGYVDFALESSASGNFRNGPVTRAELRLVRDYRYGDTTGTVTLRLRSMDAEWDPTAASSDTMLAAGPAILDFTIQARDTLVVVRLPQAWVTANESLLRGESFASGFHGFQIEPVSGNRVTGFRRNRSKFRVVSGADSTDYATVKTFSAVARTGEPNIPADYVLLQDGFSRAVTVDFTFEQSEALVNRVLLRLPADTTLLRQNLPSGFVRPTLREINVLGIDDAGRIVTNSRLLPQLQFTTILAADATFSLGVPQFTSAAAPWYRGVGEVTMLQVTAPFTNTLNPVLLRRPGGPARAPELVLTLTPVDR